jgi:Protein of unknown function (DUF3592)
MLAGMTGKVGDATRGAISTYAAFWALAFRWGLCLAGTAFLVVGVAMGASTLLFVRTSVAATGTVVSNVRIEQRSSEDQQVTTTFAPEFTFTSTDGKTYTVTSGNSSNPPEFAEGQAVRVLYNPMNPGSARIDSFWQMWGMATMFGGCGTVLAAIGYTWMYFVVRRNREILSIR